MKIQQLEYFCAIVEEKSISAAARKLHVSQPPISRQIALLEHELGVTLFTRGNKGMLPTEAGRSLYQQSQELIRSMDQIAQNVRNIESGMRGILKIGAIYSTMPYAIPMIREYHRRWPQVELYIRSGTPQELMGELNSGALSAVFLRTGKQELTGIREIILGEDDLELILTEDLDPAPGLESVPLELLQGVPFCMFRSDDFWGYDEYVLRECHRNGIEPKIACQCYDTPTAMRLVHAGLGVCVMPRAAVETDSRPGVYAKPIKGISVKSYCVLAWNENAYQANCVKLFTEMALP